MKRQTITAARLFVHVTVVSGPYAAVRRRASPTNQKPHSEARVLTDREPGEGGEGGEGEGRSHILQRTIDRISQFYWRGKLHLIS